MYQKETRLPSSFLHSIMKKHARVSKQYHKPEIIMHYNATKSGFHILDKLMREYTSTTSTRHRHLKLFLSLIAVTFVNAIVLWMLKYPNWQQKKNN